MALQLLPHQEDLVDKMVRDEDTYEACVNFSQMGLGKSACAIALMLRRPKNFNLLVVPKNIIQNWINELSKFTNWNVMVFDRRYSKIEDIMDYDVVITTYDLLYSRGANGSLKTILHEVDFDRIVMDECHLIRNHKTKRFQSANLLKGDCKVLLSGTPISGTGTKRQEFNSYSKLLRVSREEFKELYQRKTLNDVEGMPEESESDKSEEITVTVDGTFKIKEIKLNISELDQTRIKKIENNLLATINKAIEKSQKNANSQLGSITNLLGM